MSDVPEGYKMSEVGVIPEDWNVKQIKDVCKLINGRGFKPYEWGKEGFPIIRIQNLNGSDEYNYYQGKFNIKIVVEYGQLLFAWSGSRGTSFGPYIWKGQNGLLNYHTWKVNINEANIEKTYFYHALKQLTKIIEGMAHGASALVHTQKWEMEGFEIPLPPTKAEQQAIASALSDTGALITALEQLITKKRNIKKGAMQQLLTCEKRLSGFEGEWRMKKLGEVLKVRHGKSQQSIIDENGLYPILATGGEIGRANTFLYNKPSVLIGRKGTIDVPQYMETPFWTIDTLFFTEISDNSNPKFIFYKFNLIDWYSHNEASGVPSLNASKIEKIELPFPPTIDEQNAIAQILSDMDAEIEALKQKQVKYKAIKQGMMQELLTGKTRLV